MKCPVCQKGEMIIKEGIMPIDGFQYNYYACPKCGEEIMNSPQLKELADKYRKLRKAKEVTFSKWGNSLAVRIPAEIVSEYKLKAGKQGLITKDKTGIKIVMT